MEITFKREDLYNEVWSTPMIKLGEKYGLSDNGLRRVCRALNIPVPERGYWAKRAAGQATDIEPLPVESLRSVFTSRRSGQPRFAKELATDNEWLQEKLHQEDEPTSRISVELEPATWHKVIAPLRRSVERAAAKEKEGAAKRAEHQRKINAEKRRNGWNPVVNMESWRQWWEHPDDGGQLVSRLIPNMLRVSPRTFARALAIANALTLAAIRRGCAVSMTTDERLAIDYECTYVHVEIREVQGKLLDPITRKSRSEPSDKLVLVATRPSGSKFELADTATERLEDQLQTVFKKLYRNVVTTRERDRQAEVARKQRDDERQERQRIYALEVEEATRRAQEAERRRQLLRDAGLWAQAQRIRAFVTHIESGEAPHTEWAAWARAVADEIDPTAKVGATSRRPEAATIPRLELGVGHTR